VETTIGFVLSERIAAHDIVGYGQSAQASGFAQLLLADRFQPAPDSDVYASQCWVTLSALGQRTSRIMLGARLPCPAQRYHPLIIAQTFATLSCLYPGRIFLGLESTDSSHAQPGSADHLVEAISIIRRLWQGGPVTHHGRYFHLHDSRLAELPTRPIPLYLCAHDAAGMRFAGRHGDGLITDADTALNPELRAAFALGAREMHLDLQQLPIIAELVVVVGGPIPSAAFAQTHPDVVSPTPQAHLEAIYALIDAGVTTISISAAQPDQRQAMAFYAEQVLPQLKQPRERVYMA
jgi:F420-dependent hydroxymycolic acid dehydrogenase